MPSTKNNEKEQAQAGTPLPLNAALLYPGQTVESLIDLLDKQELIAVPRQKLEKIINANKNFRELQKVMQEDIFNVISAFAKIQDAIQNDKGKLAKMMLPGFENPFAAEIQLFADFVDKYSPKEIETTETPDESSEGKEVQLNSET